MLAVVLLFHFSPMFRCPSICAGFTAGDFFIKLTDSDFFSANALRSGAQGSNAVPVARTTVNDSYVLCVTARVPLHSQQSQRGPSINAS